MLKGGQKWVGYLLIAVFQFNTQAMAQSFQELGFLSHQPQIHSQAWSISKDGTTVVGISGAFENSHGNPFESYYWTSQTGMVGLGDIPNGIGANVAMTVSENGSVIGGKVHHFDDSPADGDTGYSYRWSSATGMVSHGPAGPNGTDERAYGLSNDGSVMVGKAHRKGYWPVAYKWTNAGGFELFNGLQASEARAISGDGSIIAGFTMPDWTNPNVDNFRSEAFTWTESGGIVGLGDLTGGENSSRALAISNDGSFITGWGTSSNGKEAVRWNGSEIIGLGDLLGGDFLSEAIDISSDGSTIVGFGTTNNGTEAFIWDQFNGIQNLKEVLISNYGLDLTGWTLTSANGISGNGLSIVGSGINPNGQIEAWVANIPEPASISFLLFGSLAILKQRKSLKQSPFRSLK